MSHTTAQIHNLSLVRTAIERLKSRQESLPGFAGLFGPAGYGKSTALLAIANETRAYYVQMRSAWSRKTLLEKICIEMDIKAAGTIPHLLDQVCQQLAGSGRPLMIDEFDFALRTDNMVELVRDIYEGSQATIIIAGEELLPQKLQRWERFYSRVLTWIPAQPVSLDDARALVPIYCPGVHVADDMLDRLVKIAAGSVRRVCVNLSGISEVAAIEALDTVSLAAWGTRPLFTGEVPRRAA